MTRAKYGNINPTGSAHHTSLAQSRVSMLFPDLIDIDNKLLLAPFGADRRSLQKVYVTCSHCKWSQTFWSLLLEHPAGHLLAASEDSLEGGSGNNQVSPSAGKSHATVGASS